MNLDELKSHFDPFLPKIFEKPLPLGSKLRKRELCDLRYIYFRIARNMGHVLTDIAKSVNKRDHTTIIHGLQQFRNLHETSEAFRNKYQTIIHYIKSKYEPSTMDNLDKMEC
jgi:hypothetical protein